MVSICIATYNGEENLYETLTSIQNQSYTDFECIIVDDHSTDDTIHIISNFAKRDKRFKLFVNMTDSECPYVDAHNKSYEYASGNLLFRVDQDDILTRDYVKTYVDYMANPENSIYDAMSTYPIFFQMIDGKQHIIEFISRERMIADVESFNSEQLLTFNSKPDSWFNQASCLRKSFYDKYKPKFTHAKQGDIVFWWNVLSFGGRLKSFPMNLMYKRHTDHTSYYSGIYNISKNENLFQADIARYKEEAFKKLYQRTNNDKYLECIQVFKNTVDYFTNLNKEQ
jgi:glycosyltransferase involved in cell wall biosynthesis